MLLYFWVFLIVFQRFDELAFLFWRILFCSFQNQCCAYINKPTLYRCCLSLNSDLIKMQFFSMMLYFHMKNEINYFSFRCFSSFLWSLFDNSYFAELLSEVYLEPSRTSMMELFCENNRRKILHHRCSAGF